MCLFYVSDNYHESGYMEMLSNGFGCIKKCSNTLKTSLFDWILHKFNSILARIMSDVPTASTSTASTSSASLASTSQTNPYTFRLANQDINMDCTTTDDSEMSSDEESETLDEESSVEDDFMYRANEKMDDSSWSSATSSIASCENNSTSENSDSEKSILKELLNDKCNEDKPDPLTPILILVQLNEIGIDTINVEEHVKRLRELETQLDYIESTEWMYRPIDLSIR